jgi:hypothetical protein
MLFRKLLTCAALLLTLAHPALTRATPTIADITQEQWIEVSSTNFRVVTDQSEKVARQMVVDLENLRYVSNKLRGATSLEGPPLTIVAVGRDSAEALQIPKEKEGIFKLSRRGYAAIAKVADSGGRANRLRSRATSSCTSTTIFY